MGHKMNEPVVKDFSTGSRGDVAIRHPNKDKREKENGERGEIETNSFAIIKATIVDIRKVEMEQ